MAARGGFVSELGDIQISSHSSFYGSSPASSSSIKSISELNVLPVALPITIHSLLAFFVYLFAINAVLYGLFGFGLSISALSQKVRYAIRVIGCIFRYIFDVLLGNFIHPTVYIIGYQVFTPPGEWKVSSKRFDEVAGINFKLPQETVEFCRKVLSNNGLGQNTYFPPGILSLPPDISLPRAREEAEIVMFGTLQGLFHKTGISPRDIDILIVNCSLFNPTPSLASMIINKFNMKSDIKSFNLSGMGCSAGVLSTMLAKDLLKLHRNSIAVVVSTENITQNIYLGRNKSMLVSNTLFRCGGAAIMLTNRPKDLLLGKVNYEMCQAVRTTLAGDNAAYKDLCEEGFRGVKLDKALMSVAAKGLTVNLSKLGPQILPLSEQWRYLKWHVCSAVYSWIQKNVSRLLSKEAKLGENPGLEAPKRHDDAATSPSPTVQARKIYVPDFTKAVQHFCIHSGGRAVIDAIQTSLRLSDEHVKASRETLFRWGNVSSASIWYELQYLEDNMKVKRGDKVLQLGFGSGFKINSAVLKKL